MKTSKKIISLVLCAVMVATTFLGAGLASMIKADAITIGGITQQRVVSNHESLYRSYQKRFFGGEETNWPTNFVIPGLSSADDYTPQGMTYWKAKEWILISAYDATTVTKNEGESDEAFAKRKYETLKNSVIYALDVVTTDLVAVFKIENADGTKNQSHGGGIAASEYNFYYADDASKISYIPLSEMDISGGEKTIRLRDSVDFAKEMTGSETGQTVKTSYCCYDDGILWTGNFNWSGETQYAANYHATYKSVLMGYKLSGNSSEEEWYYLKNGYNIAKITKADGETTTTEYSNSKTSEEGDYTASIKYTKVEVDGAHLEVRGTVTSNATADSESVRATRVGEITTPNNIGSFDLVEGTQYKISFISTNKDTDIYMWSPGGKHCNVKQSQSSKITDLGNGKYHYQMIFTAGVKPTGADSSWQAAGADDGTSYTGTYSFRIDQDNVLSSYDFAVTDISVCEYSDAGITVNPDCEGVGCAGNPTYVVAMDTDRIQYAMVDKGKLYVSRSWSRTQSGNHTRELMIADIDLNRPGDVGYPVNGRNHNIYLINYSDASVTHFGGNYKESDNGVSAEELNRMLWMGEALCVINDYLYMFGEGAAWNYNGKTSDNVCGEPIDVIWKIDQYAIQGLTRPHEDVAAVEYEKVTSLSQINSTDEYIVLYESSIKDPVTQRNILYLLDAFGGYGDMKLPKKTNPNSTEITAASTGDSRGIVGYEIRNYSVDGTTLILNAEDDANKSLHWQFESGSSTALKLRSRELYYAKHPYLYSGDTLFAMTSNASTTMTIKDWGNGDFTIYGSGENYSIWCNDGSVPESITKYTNAYASNTQNDYIPNYHNLEEVAGTFHITNSTQPAMPTNEQQGLSIYKRVTDPYASSYETQVYTDLQAELTADGTYNITLETYATNALQYQRVDQRPTDFVFVVDVSGSMDKVDAQGYQTDTNWSALKQNQVCAVYTSSDNTVSDSFFEKGKNYNTALMSKFFYRLPDGVYGRIGFAFNGKDSGNPTYGRDFWMWVEHPETGRCYRLSKLGFLTYGNFSGDAADNDRSHRLAEADYLANPQSYGWANRDAVMSDVVNDANRTDYISDSFWDYGSTSKRANYSVLEAKYTNDSGVQVMTYYTYGACQRILGVKQAIDKLAVKIQKEATQSDLDHRIAIVTSGSDGTYVSDNRPWANTGILTNDGTWRNYTGGTSLDSYYSSAFFSAKNSSHITSIRNYITNTLPCYGHSPINQGLTLASNIINAQKSQGNTYDVNGNRSCVVVVISDGAAGGDNSDYNNATNATSCANDAIGNGGLSLKKNGAYIFTVQIGSEDYVSGFEETDFMKYLSSRYTGSVSMSDPGPLNTKENNYYINVPVGSSFNIDTITNTVFNEVIANSNNAIASLNTNAVLREHLTDAFDLTNATITYKTAKSKYDGIGRLYFEAPQTTSGVTATIDKNTNNIEVTGFDYTAKNVSEYNSKNGNGAKLVIEITGVIADADAELLNTSINDTSKTALYQDRSYMSDILSNDKPVKRFPTYHFSIPEYTYYMDYDIPMYDSDINGTLCSVDSTLQKQSTYKTSLSTGNMGIQFVNNNLDMVYTLNSQAGLTEKLSKGYVLIKRDDGTYDWFRLNIVPASTVYYEENKMETLDGTQSFTEWTETGLYANKYQSLSTENDIFGRDEIYYNSTESFSLGTNKSVTVTAENNRSDTQTFTFTGTGFDLISACGTNTGIQIVTVKKHLTDSNGNVTGMELAKVYMVDTFYNDSNYNTVYQVPIVQFRETIDDDDETTEKKDVTYTVETTATYFSFAGGLKTQSVDTQAVGDTGLEATTGTVDTAVTDELFAQVGMDELIGQDVELIWMDDNSVLNGGTGAEGTTLSTQAGEKSLINYIDGFRIYNPNTYNDEYIESEKNASFYSVIDAITAGDMGGNSLVAYIEPGAEGEINFGNYLTSGGPKYEVYLAPKNSIAFKFKAGSTPTAMISLRAASIKNGTPMAKVNSAEFTVISASETYYDITPHLGSTDDNGFYTVTVTNNGGGLLAVDNIKLTNASLVPMNGASLAELNELISSQAVEIDPFAPKTVTYTYSEAPADNPNIDPEGSLPDISEFIKETPDEPAQDDTCEFKAILNKIIEFFKKIFATVASWFAA